MILYLFFLRWCSQILQLADTVNLRQFGIGMHCFLKVIDVVAFSYQICFIDFISTLFKQYGKVLDDLSKLTLRKSSQQISLLHQVVHLALIMVTFDRDIVFILSVLGVIRLIKMLFLVFIKQTLILQLVTLHPVLTQAHPT